MKRKKKLLLQEEKKGAKKFDLRPPGIEPRPADSEWRANHSVIDAYGTDTWLGHKHMRLRLAY